MKKTISQVLKNMYKPKKPNKESTNIEKNIKGDRKTKSFHILRIFKIRETLRVRLIAAFMVPIAFIIILGIISFSVASDSIKKNYEKSSLQSIKMTGEYMRFGLESIKATSLQYANDDTISKFFSNLYKDDKAGYNAAYKSISGMLSAKQISDEFIGNITIIADGVKPITTSGNDISDGFLAGLEKTELGSYLKENRMKEVWTGSNEYLDEQLATGANDYSMRLVRYLSKSTGCLVIDVNVDTVKSILKGLEFDQSGFLALVTSEGKEITEVEREEGAEAIFTKEDFFKKAIASENSSEANYVTYQGESYLFMNSKIGETGAMICALMPKDAITKQAYKIENVTIAVVTIAIILAGIIVLIITQGIDKTIKGIIQPLKRAANGDLTVKFDSKRKDEFHILIEEIQNTFTKMKELIKQVNNLSTEVSTSSENVTNSSEQFVVSAKNISSAMYEIEQGISQQAKDSEECLMQMDNLSKKIKLVGDNTLEIGQIADATRIKIQEGTDVTEALNTQTQSTIEIATDIINDIEKLDNKSLSISKIVKVINEIANQTNLLSLNASIEAARAGEYGRGFSVVASEIRILAEQSQNSANEIKKIIESIQSDTKKAVDTARRAENVLMLQGTAVKNTTDSFKSINSSVEKLMVYLNHITQNVGNMDQSRVSTLGAIENISAVLEEIAASINTVSNTSTQQLEAVESLNKTAELLNENSDILVQEVNKFTVE